MELVKENLKNVPNASYLNMDPLVEVLAVNTTLKKLQLDWESFRLSGDVTEKLMANGVLLQLLMTAIEMTVREFGWENTGCALVAVLEELQWETCLKD